MSDRSKSARRLHAGVAVYDPGGVSPEAITEVLGVAPDRAIAKGTVRSPGDAPLPHTAWTITSDGHVDSQDPEEHIVWALNAVAPGAAGLRELMAAHERIEAHVRLYWNQSEARDGFLLGPVLAERIGALPARFVVSQYTYNVKAPPEGPEQIHATGYGLDGAVVVGSRDLVSSNRPYDHVGWLLEERARRDLRFGRIAVTWVRWSDNVAFNLPAEQMATIGALGIPLEFDLGAVA